ncbi:MAG: VIT domain-containing protein, partial [Acidobacteriota bacterium]|nr:VIT domain-containing protein [Acidobacteriota bacterium]
MKQILLTAITFLFTTISISAFDGDITQGTLRAAGKDGALGDVTLKRTDVRADISGFIARVNVRQEFVNNFGEPIEAVYVFPLSHDGAVDRMTMKIGSRTIKGVVMRREEARKAYETAKQAGQTAALLDQERPNIFTQSVANILPGESIVIDISYVETLKYEGGTYEFVFPMVVGPRYNPGARTGVRSGGGTSEDTNQVPDASKITPGISKNRTGHDVSVEVNLEAGVPIQNLVSELHKIETQNLSASRAAVKLRNETTIPNRDFILRYDVTGLKIEDAVLIHRDSRGGFFSMIIQPPDDMTIEDLTPKEIVFVLDTSGSMGGFPIEKAKEAMLLSLEGLHPRDTFNIITFAGDTRVLFDEPVPATQGHLETAKAFLKSRSGGGGTEMMKAIRAALEPSGSQEHLRIVCFMTDGYVGNDMAIIEEIQKHENARVFSFGIGNSVNRYLLENMASQGNGEAEIIMLESESKAAAERFYKRVRTPVLTDLSIDWNGMPVDDVYPSKLTDLFTAKPVVVNGRFTDSRSGSIKLKGKIAGQYYEREIKVEFPDQESGHDVLATLWARRKVSELMNKDLSGIQNRNGNEEIEEQITNIGLEFGILTQFTSFVAIEERAVNPDGNPLKVDVPVENPDGHQLESPVVRLNQTQYFDPSSGRVTVKEKGKQQISVNGGASGVTTSNTGGGIGGGTGSGSGTGRGSAAGSGNGAGPVTAVVNVTTDSAATMDMSSTKLETNITKNGASSLPSGTSFSSLLKIAPNKTAVSLSAGFQVNGASGTGNVFVVDGQEATSFRTGTLNVDVG